MKSQWDVQSISDDRNQSSIYMIQSITYITSTAEQSVSQPQNWRRTSDLNAPRGVCVCVCACRPFPPVLTVSRLLECFTTNNRHVHMCWPICGGHTSSDTCSGWDRSWIHTWVTSCLLFYECTPATINHSTPTASAHLHVRHLFVESPWYLLEQACT